MIIQLCRCVLPSGAAAGLMSAVLGLLVIVNAADANAQFELREGDKVVLLGGALVEQEQLHGHWETLLTAAYPDRQVHFRNLGWSGDTVWGESRGMFEPHEGYQRLLEHIRHENPSVIVIAYGNSEAFAGEAGLEPFAAQLKQLTADLSADSRRFVFLSPLMMEAESLPESSNAEEYARAYNRDLVQYADVIRSCAKELQAPLVDLMHHQIESEGRGSALTDNGLRLTADGYRQTARWIASRLKPQRNSERLAAVVDLDFETPPAIELREAIQAKNQLYFHRWRPQNFTYLFGFRKHEQGNNAVEIPQFDPLVAAAEKQIAALAAELKVE